MRWSRRWCCPACSSRPTRRLFQPPIPPRAETTQPWADRTRPPAVPIRGLNVADPVAGTAAPPRLPTRQALRLRHNAALPGADPAAATPAQSATPAAAAGSPSRRPRRPRPSVWRPSGRVGRPRPGAAASASVTIENFAFAPPTVTVNVGDTVTWSNADADVAEGHSATASDGSFDTGVFPAGERPPRYPDTAGPALRLHPASQHEGRSSCRQQALAVATPARGPPKAPVRTAGSGADLGSTAGGKKERPRPGLLAAGHRHGRRRAGGSRAADVMPSTAVRRRSRDEQPRPAGRVGWRRPRARSAWRSPSPLRMDTIAAPR